MLKCFFLLTISFVYLYQIRGKNMFTMPNDEDLTKELAVEQLIKATEESTGYIWGRKDYNTYFQYLFESRINETMSICFRIYHYKTHDRHVLNIYLSRRRSTAFVSIFSVEGPLVLNLIKVIEKDKYFNYKEE